MANTRANSPTNLPPPATPPTSVITSPTSVITSPTSTVTSPTSTVTSPTSVITSPKPQEQPRYTLDPQLVAVLREHLAFVSERIQRTKELSPIVEKAAINIRDRIGKTRAAMGETSDILSKLTMIGPLDSDSDSEA